MNNMESRLENLLKLQMMFQNKYQTKLLEKSKNRQMITHTDALLVEAVEVKQELNWKSWKALKEIDWEKVKEEIVDEFIFLLNQCNVAEMDADDLVARTLDKINTNIQRQEQGY